MLRCRAILVSLALFLLAPLVARADEFLMQLELRGKVLQGTVISADERAAHLLARDGRLWEFAPSEAKKFSKLSDDFRPYSAGELRAQLLREFGGEFDVSGTGHYLVVHRAGERDLWADRFEELYRNFQHYFTARGFSPRAPRFPLVAVVLPRQQDFLEYARREGMPANFGVLGYYSSLSNRVLMYDETRGQGAAASQWYRNAETIIHEATHQTAFNTGVHTRYTMPPRWVAEGLATMFEARGVWDASFDTNRENRVNRSRLAEFNRYMPRRPKGALAEFISSDRLYQTDPSAAYAEGWALTFFLAETEPRKYSQYLEKTAALPAFRAYSAPDRVKDFTAIFGANLGQLEARYLRFMEELK